MSRKNVGKSKKKTMKGGAETPVPSVNTPIISPEFTFNNSLNTSTIQMRKNV